MERKKKRKTNSNSTNNNNNIININLGKELKEYIKHTEIKEKYNEPKIKQSEKIKQPEIDDEIYSDELKEITNQYITLKNQASNQGINLPSNLSVIPSNKLKMNNVNDIIALTNYIKNLIEQIKIFIANYKQTPTPQATTQTTTQSTQQSTQAGKPYAYPQTYNYRQPQYSPYSQYQFPIGIPTIQPVKPSPAPAPAPVKPVQPTETPTQPETTQPETTKPTETTETTKPPPPYEPETKPPPYEPDIQT